MSGPCRSIWIVVLASYSGVVKSVSTIVVATTIARQEKTTHRRRPRMCQYSRSCHAPPDRSSEAWEVEDPSVGRLKNPSARPPEYVARSAPLSRLRRRRERGLRAERGARDLEERPERDRGGPAGSHGPEEGVHLLGVALPSAARPPDPPAGVDLERAEIVEDGARAARVRLEALLREGRVPARRVENLAGAPVRETELDGEVLRRPLRTPGAPGRDVHDPGIPGEEREEVEEVARLADQP